MRLISRSAQAVVSFVGIPHPALAYMGGIVVRHLRVTLITGGRSLASAFYPANFPGGYEGEVDNRLSKSVCQAQKSATIPPDHPTSCVTRSILDLTLEQRCSLFI
jgi:hypothetical protein